ncbi:hypothetical protein DVH24_021716, partial [Malus domestica]
LTHTSLSVFSPFLYFELLQQPRHNPSATPTRVVEPITDILESSLYIQSKSLTYFIKFEVDRFELQIYVVKVRGFSGGFALVKGGQFSIFMGFVGFDNYPNGKIGLDGGAIGGVAAEKDLERDGAGVFGEEQSMPLLLQLESTPKISVYTLHKCIFLSNYRKFGVSNEIFEVLKTIPLFILSTWSSTS